MAPVTPVGQGGLSYQRPAQHPGVWQFVDAVEEETSAAVVTPAVMPAASLPRISLQVQELLSQPGALDGEIEAAFTGQQRRKTASSEARPAADRRKSDRRARRRETDLPRA